MPGMAACWGTWTGRHVLSVATGAGAIYLLYKTVADGLSSAPDSTECYRLESPDHREGGWERTTGVPPPPPPCLSFPSCGT